MDIKERLSTAQASVKALGRQRETLVGDLRVAENNVAQSREALAQLGVPDAATLTIEQLRELEGTVTASLNSGVAQLEQQIIKANEVLEAYAGVK